MIKARTLQDLFRRYRRPGDLVFGLAFLVFAVFIVYSLPTEATLSGRGSLFAKPAFYVHVAAYAMLLFAVLHVFSSLVSEALEGRWREVWLWLRSIEYAVWFLAYVVIAPVLGYLLATLVFTLSLTVRLGYRSRRALALTAFFSVCVVVVFKSFLQVKVPGGQLYEYLPSALRTLMLTYF
ncbi:MAG: tripartite tricarboxylate transporter TctB family protein [Pseudomonadota bacterium]